MGWMWFASAWLIFFDRFPTRRETEARYPAFASLFDFAGPTGTVVILSFLAYIIGSLNVDVLGWARDKGYRFAYGRPGLVIAIDKYRDSALERRVGHESAGVDLATLPHTVPTRGPRRDMGYAT